MKNPKKLIALLSAVVALSVTAMADDDAAPTKPLPPVSTQTGVTYATDIKPILDKSCAKCHSGDKPKARLKLDSLEGILKGSRNGKVVVVGDSSKSVLVLAAAHATDDEDEWMPPAKAAGKFPPLTADQIGLIRAWIDQGAK